MSFQAERLIVGHRGAAGLAPENTLAGFSTAVSLGVDAVELDVHCVHGRLLVIHDDHLDRTTSGKGELKGLGIAALRALDAGGGQSIPFLEEVFDALPPAVGINVELKGPRTAEPVLAMLRNSQGSARDVLVSAFDLDELRHFVDLAGIRHQLPAAHANALATKVGDGCGLAGSRFMVAPLFDRWNKNLLEVATALGAWSVNLSVRAATRQRIAEARARGFRVLVYTVNDPAIAERLFSWGASGIFTDFPDRMIGRVAPARE